MDFEDNICCIEVERTSIHQMLGLIPVRHKKSGANRLNLFYLILDKALAELYVLLCQCGCYIRDILRILHIFSSHCILLEIQLVLVC